LPSSNRGQWWKLPPTHPVRINREVVQARSALRDVRARVNDDDPSAWEIDLEARGVDLSTSPNELVKAQERYDRKRATWEAAGCPNTGGKRTQPRKNSRATAEAAV